MIRYKRCFESTDSSLSKDKEKDQKDKTLEQITSNSKSL